MTKVPQSAVDRVARRYLAAQDVPVDAAEVLNWRLEGQTVQKHIQQFLTHLVQEGQGVNKRLEGARQAVAGLYKAEVPPQDLYAAVYRVVEQTWGKDALTPLLARLIVRGDFVY